MEAKKTHRLTLGKHSEEVSDKELATLQERYKRNFPYDVEALQPEKPADEAPVKTPAKPKDAEKAA